MAIKPMPPPPAKYPASGGIQPKAPARAVAVPPPIRYPVVPTVQAKPAGRPMPPPVAFPRLAAVQQALAPRWVAPSPCPVSPPPAPSRVQRPVPAPHGMAVQRMISQSHQQAQSKVDAEKATVQPLVTRYYAHTLMTYITGLSTGALTNAIDALRRSIAARQAVQGFFTDTTTPEYIGHANRITDEQTILAALEAQRGPYVNATNWVRDDTAHLEHRIPGHWARDGAPAREERSLPDDDGFMMVRKKR